MASPKIDLYKLYKQEYVAPQQPVALKVKPAKYLTFSGTGAPGGPIFQSAINALYNVAFTIKMTKKFAGLDYRVSHLEGLWWGNQEGIDFIDNPPDSWHWKLMIRVPDFIKKADLKEAVAKLKAKGKAAEVSLVMLEKIAEGRCVQMLHVGPYAAERHTIAQMLDFARGKGLSCKGPHHEIYLSDPRRVPPERLKTILRHPVH